MTAGRAAVSIGGASSEKAKSKLPSRRPSAHPLGGSLAQADLDLGEARGEAGQERGDVEPAAEQQRAAGHPPAHQSSQLIDLAPQQVRFVEDPARASGDQDAASVGSTERVVRFSNSTPSSSSSRRTWCESADWAMWSSSAARVKCR